MSETMLKLRFTGSVSYTHTHTHPYKRHCQQTSRNTVICWKVSNVPIFIMPTFWPTRAVEEVYATVTRAAAGFSLDEAQNRATLPEVLLNIAKTQATNLPPDPIRPLIDRPHTVYCVRLFRTVQPTVSCNHQHNLWLERLM